MAMIKPIHGEMKGSIAGNTWQAGRFGQVVRQKRTPVNPATEAQGTVRVDLAQANAGWKAITQANRENWSEFAQNTPWRNAFGDETLLTGRQMYVRTNTFITASGGVPQANPPATPGLSSNPDFTLLGTTMNGIQVDDYDLGGGSADIIRFSLAGPFAPSRQKHKGPWRSTVYITSDTMAPFELLASSEVQAGQVYFAATHYMNPEGNMADQILIKRVEVV